MYLAKLHDVIEGGDDGVVNIDKRVKCTEKIPSGWLIWLWIFFFPMLDCSMIRYAPNNK